MLQTCPKCHRANPADALYCYQDGFALGGRNGHAGPVDPGAQPFLHPFVFPNGAVCRNFDQLALACHNEWSTAIELLRHGDLANFLAGLGRADLARAAREAARESDKDRALDQLLGQLPANTIEPAKLHVATLQLNVGQLSVGNDHRSELRLANQGMRMLSGTIAVEDGAWLTLGEGGGSPRKVFQFLSTTTIPVQIRGKLLRAAAKPIQGRLAIETNGGSAVVVVVADVPVKPFVEGVLAGAITPRQVAEKAKRAPKEAAPLFESGAVARWYIQNGWTYPVQGPSASGLGAVQQYFEALGLTHPPKVEVRESSLSFEARPGGSVHHTLDVSAVEKRPVFASAFSDAPWLKVSKVVLDGRTAHVQLAVEPAPDRPGETLQANVTVRANGNQRFVVPVSLRVLGKPRTTSARKGGDGIFPALEVVEVTDAADAMEPLVVASAAESPPVRRPPDAFQGRLGARPPQTVQSKIGRGAAPVLEAIPLDDDEDHDARSQQRRGAGALILPLLPVAFILLGLFTAVGRDVIAAAFFHGVVEPGVPTPGAAGPLTPLIRINFHDQVEDVTAGESGAKHNGGKDEEVLWDPTMHFGVVMTNQTDASGKPKRLTYFEKGFTNNCCLRIDGSERLFGEQPFRKKVGETPRLPGRWTDKTDDLGTDPATGIKRDGKRWVWYYDAEKVAIAQTVELTVGESGQLDTCLVRYKIDNKDTKSHIVGLRFLLDTYIGSNDGVPFLIPGQDRLCDTTQDLSGAAVPQYIQAFERDDVSNPGTIARVQLKLGGNVEPPSRITLGAYPDPKLGEKMNDKRCMQEKTGWDVPVYPIKTIPPGDSCVTMYWPMESLAAGASRELGFAYGLGDVAASESGGQLGLTADGNRTPGGELTVTAYVTNPGANHTVTLTLPKGFEMSDGGAATRPVPAAAGVSRMSPVTWKVKAGAAGDYTLKAESSTGAAQTKKITIKAKTLFGGN
jgi:hypothetical protein